MVTIAPHLRVRGRVRQTSTRSVQPFEGSPEKRDPTTNRTLQRARDASPGYDCVDLVIDTDPGGLITVTMREEVTALCEGYLPAVGEMVDLPVRAYDLWTDTSYRNDDGSIKRRRTNGYSVVGDALAAERVRDGQQKVQKVPA